MINQNIFNITFYGKDDEGNDIKIEIPQAICHMDIEYNMGSLPNADFHIHPYCEDKDGKLFSMTIDDKKAEDKLIERGESEMSDTTNTVEKEFGYSLDLIAVRFPIQSGYDLNSKLYYYLIHSDDRINIGTYFKAKDSRKIRLNTTITPDNAKRISIRSSSNWNDCGYRECVLRVEGVKKNISMDDIAEVEKHIIAREFVVQLTVDSIEKKDFDYPYVFKNIDTFGWCEDCAFRYSLGSHFYEDYDKLVADINPENVEALASNKPSLTDEYTVQWDASRAINSGVNINNINTFSKEEKRMDIKKLMGDFVFGTFNADSVKYSFNGIAFKSTDGTYNVYEEDGSLTNVSDMVMDIPVFAMPVSKAKIGVGDVILHPTTKKPLIVKENTETAIVAVEPNTTEIKTLAPKKSIFGFDFYTKIMTPMDMCGDIKANEDNPFGNMLPFLMMKDGGNNNDMLTMMMLSGQFKNFNDNPMLMMMLFGDNKNNNDMLTMMMLSGMMKNKQ